MAASTPTPLGKNSQEAFIKYYNVAMDLQNQQRTNLRTRFELIDKEYQREMDQSLETQRAKAANRAGDSDRYQNITVPVVMPQVETAVTYQASVFLTGSPLFGVVSSPQFIDEAVQLETIIDENATKGGWARQLLLFFRDGFKYNFAPMECSWEQEVTANLTTDITKSTKEGVPVDVIWSGNSLKRLDPYNTFVDPRVTPTEVYKSGEFAGYVDYMTRIQLKIFIETLPDKIIANIKPAFNSGSARSSSGDATSAGFYTPTVNPDIPSENYTTGTNWLSWAGISATRSDIEYKDMYEVTTLYCRILPSEFELKIPRSNTPQIFKLVIVNHQHIIYCERQTNAHGWIPIFVGQPKEDGLRYQTKSLADDVSPFQYVTSTLMNSIIHSRRRAISDRVLFDPSRIAAAHINSSNPSAKIPVRPAAYGKNIAEAVYQFPYREDQAQFSIQQIQQLLGLANQLTGQNQVSQGQFVKGNKTVTEFDSVMQNANGRDQVTSILLEYQVFIPIKHLLKINILQFQGGTTVYNRDKQIAIEIDPVKLRKAVLEFKISDGLTPSSKLINADSLSVALQVLGSSPQIAAGYNIAPLFSYFMKTQGAKITEFEKSAEQVAYEQAVQQWQQLAFEGIKNGIDPQKLPAQPLPKDFGYNPAGNKPAPDNPQDQSSTTPNPGAQ